jgi:hypothetical protein
MKVPVFNWIEFDKNNPPADLNYDEKYLILIAENYGKGWEYNVDVAEPYGDYLDNFWDTENDWVEGVPVKVVAYAEMPCGLKESDLVEKG